MGLGAKQAQNRESLRLSTPRGIHESRPWCCGEANLWQVLSEEVFQSSGFQGADT